MFFRMFHEGKRIHVFKKMPLITATAVYFTVKVG